MIFELRTYELSPGNLGRYVDLFRHWGVARVTQHLPMLGYWATEAGPLNTLHHLWAYESLEERDTRRAALARDEEWTTRFVPEAFAFVTRQSNRLLQLERVSPAFESALAGRLTPHRAQDAAAPAYATPLFTLSQGSAATPPPPTDAVAAWRCLAGTAPAGSWVQLRTGAPRGDEPAGCDVQVLRPLALSPLR